MTKTRMEAFSDGVIAIIITIMVLELKVPHDTHWESMKELISIFFSYLMSFVFIGIYWGNHHHLLHTVNHVNSKMLWANLHLLFWLSLTPFATAWMGVNHFESVTVATYAFLLNMCGVAYYILLRIIREGNKNHEHLLIPLKKQEKKGLRSTIAYTIAIPCAFLHPAISTVIFIAVAVMWWIPDRNIEKSMQEKN